MGKLRSQKYLIGLLLLVFTSQLLAAVSTCPSKPTVSDDLVKTVVEPMQNHSHHQTTDMQSAEEADCCPSCECVLGSCSLVVLPTLQPLYFTRASVSTTAYESLTEFELTFPLLRPPIYR